MRRRLPALESCELVEQGATSLRGQRAIAVTGEGVDATASVVAVGHQHGGARHREPGAGQQGPAFGDGPRAPGVVRRCRAPDLVDLAVGAEKSCGVSGFDDERGAFLIEVEKDGCAREVAHGEAAAAQHRWRRGRPRLEEILDETDEGEGLLTRGAVDEVRGAIAVVEGRRCRLEVSDERSAAQRHRDLAGEDDGVGSERLEQVGGEQPLHGGARLSDGTVGPFEPAYRWAPDQALERLACPGGCLAQDTLDLGGVVGVHRDSAPRVGHGRPEARGVGAECLAHGIDEVELVVGAPDQREGAEAFDRGAQSRVVELGEPGEEIGVGRRLGQGAESGDDLQGERVEAIECSCRGGAGRRTRRERGEVGRHRVDEIGPCGEQRGQRVVVAGAQVLGQGTGPRLAR